MHHKWKSHEPSGGDANIFSFVAWIFGRLKEASRLVHQLAEDCFAYFNQATLPSWDPAWLNIPRLIKPEVPEELNIDVLPMPNRQPARMSADTRPSHPIISIVRMSYAEDPLSSAELCFLCCHPHQDGFLA